MVAASPPAANRGEAATNNNICANIRNITELTLYFMPHGFFMLHGFIVAGAVSIELAVI